MGIQEVKGQSGTPAYQRRKKTGGTEGFQESFLQNLKCRDQETQPTADSGTDPKGVVTDRQTDPKVRVEKAGIGRIGAATSIRVNAATAQDAMQAVEVRHMSYEDSDHVRIAVTEGYTLKGKLLRDTDRSGQKNNHKDAEAAKVYVEAKYEDGRLEAYQVDTAKISQGTEHVIERFALETVTGV